MCAMYKQLLFSLSLTHKQNDMKLFSLIFLAGLAAKCYSQTGSKTTIYLRGKIDNCGEKVLEISSSGDTNAYSDSLKINEDGSFSYQTSKIKTPITVNISNRKQVQIPLFMAPGYNLYIKCDAKDLKTLKKTITYSGAGSSTNRYWEETLKTSNSTDTVNWWAKDEKSFVNNIISKPYNDSIEKRVFDKSNHDQYKLFFKEAMAYNITFRKLSNLFTYAGLNGYTPQTTEKFIRKYFDNNILDHISNDKYLSSPMYTYVVTNSYLNWQLEMNDKGNSSNGNNRWNRMDKILDLYNGRVRDFVLYEKLKLAVTSSTKMNELEKAYTYINKIKTTAFKDQLLLQHGEKLKVIATVAPGKPAPLFNLPDSTGNIIRLDSLKGKVIYIDLWASWCFPCRQEMPELKKIHAQYRNNNKIVFISIAVKDNANRNARYKFLNEIQPGWLQLEDQNNLVYDSYAVNGIPRYILIDKHGNIADFDAPGPGNYQRLITLLNEQITKE
jgi:thiol-disulfide isomerase/thioredoxin